MFHSCEFEFKKPPLLKKGAGVKNTFSAVASTAALDRHKEILVPKGVIVDSFMKNPVMLNIHDHKQASVGKVINIKVSDDSVQFDFQFADSDEGNKLEKLYVEGFMSAFSVGFIPKNYIDLYDVAKDPDSQVTEISVPLPDGTSTTLDLTKYAEKPYGVISKWELLEISPVSVPANPEALMLRAKDDIVRKFLDTGHSKAAASLLERQLTDKVSDIQRELDQLLKKASDSEVEMSGALAYQPTDTAEVAWDAEDAKAALALWAATDKTHAGEVDHTDWSKFAEGFAWVDLQKAGEFSGYKYLHHTTDKDSLVVVWAGLTEAMANLLADPLASDDEKVYEHLAAHYADFGKVAPAYSLEYTEEQLEKIRLGKDVDEEAPEEEENPEEVVTLTAESLDFVKVLETGFGEVNQKVADLEGLIRLRMNILARMFDELRKDLLVAKQEPAPNDDIEETDEAKLLTDELSSLASIFKQIQS